MAYKAQTFLLFPHVFFFITTLTFLAKRYLARDPCVGEDWCPKRPNATTYECRAFCFQRPTGRSHDLAVCWNRLPTSRKPLNISGERCDQKPRSQSYVVKLCVGRERICKALAGSKTHSVPYYVRSCEKTSKPFTAVLESVGPCASGCV
jgi:hypothetical protein